MIWVVSVWLLGVAFLTLGVYLAMKTGKGLPPVGVSESAFALLLAISIVAWPAGLVFRGLKRIVP